MKSARNMRRTTGAEILKRSHQNPPNSVRTKRTNETIETTDPARISHHHSTMKPESTMRNFVGPGSASSFPLKTPAKRGSTKVRRKTVVDTAMRAMMPG